MKRVWRICKAKWAGTAFSGSGAAENPGRWNSGGIRAVYCAETRALAFLELLAHVGNKRYLRHAKLVVIPADIPEEGVVAASELPEGWDSKPATDVSRRFGDKALDTVNGAVALRVPSVVVPGEFCCVLNPLHRRFAAVKTGEPEDFPVDPRLSLGTQLRKSGRSVGRRLRDSGV